MRRIDGLRHMDCEEVRAALEHFSPAYAKDWESWLAAAPDERLELFGRILRTWQAVRPRATRRPRSEDGHEPPYLDDLLDRASGPIDDLTGLRLCSFDNRTPVQTLALQTLWIVFKDLAVTGSASAVGISKAVMLLTFGRLGPGLDSNVVGRLHIMKPTTGSEWIQTMDAIADDLKLFEARHGHLRNCAPERYAHLECGRLYDMVFGPGRRQA